MTRNHMSLEDQINQILINFENISSERILDTLNQITPFFTSPHVSKYLQGKIQKIQNTKSEPEKKKMCAALMPYLDWYLQGPKSA